MPTALITGASSGIGKALAVELGRRKYKLGLTARREKELQEVAEAARSAGCPEAAIHAADVADRGQVEAAARALEEKLGGIDLLVANAGIGHQASYSNPLDVDPVEKLFRVNLFGVIYSIGAVLPGMLARGSGHISAVSSLAGYRALPRFAAYCASKAAVSVLLEGLRLDLRGRVSVSIINPGFVDTPLLGKNKDKFPFVVPVEKAARRIVDGLERRKRVIEFPFPLVAATKLGRALPSPLYDWLLGSRPPRGGPAPSS